MSIILPTYNRAKFLPRSIGSVLKQTYQNWELIVWDDGSQDNTEDVIKYFNDQRIHYYFDDNHGVSYARNRAIEKAKGKYIAFLDSDDEWLPGKLSQQIKKLSKHPEIDFLFSNFNNINIEKNVTRLSFSEHVQSMELLVTEENGKHLYLIKGGFLESIATGNYIATDTVILKRSLIDPQNNFNETLRNAVDFEFWWRLGINKTQIAFLDLVLINRYKPAGSLSSSSIISLINAIKALDLCSQTAEEYQREDLLPYLNKSYRNTWHNMITACAQAGNRKCMLNAFFQSLKYGFRLGSIRLLFDGYLRKNPTEVTNKGN